MFEWVKSIFSGDKSKSRGATLEKRGGELKELPIEARQLSESNTEEEVVSVRKIKEEIGELSKTTRRLKFGELLQLYNKLPEIRALIEEELEKMEDQMDVQQRVRGGRHVR
jgi:hypothetical protein